MEWYEVVSELVVVWFLWTLLHEAAPARRQTTNESTRLQVQIISTYKRTEEVLKGQQTT